MVITATLVVRMSISLIIVVTIVMLVPRVVMIITWVVKVGPG